MSESLLDNLGVHINLADLPSAEIYTEAFSAYYGKGRLGRFWAMRIRPVIMPWNHYEINQRFRRAQRTMRQELLSTMLERAFTSEDYPIAVGKTIVVGKIKDD